MKPPGADEQAMRQTTKEEQAREAWAAISKPVTEETFVTWYCANHNRKSQKRAVDQVDNPSSAPVQKRQATSTASLALPKGKKTALLKGIVAGLKKGVKAKKWHCGDSETIINTTVCDSLEFPALFPDASFSSSGGLVTTFSLNTEMLKSAFGNLITGIKVQTFNRPRSFQKSYKTGSQEVTLSSAECKYSKGTSNLTLKFSVTCGGGHDYFGCDY